MSYTLAARQCFVCAAQATLIALDIREATHKLALHHQLKVLLRRMTRGPQGQKSRSYHNFASEKWQQRNVST